MNIFAQVKFMILKIASICCAVFSSLPVPFLPKIMPVVKPAAPPVAVSAAAATCNSLNSANCLNAVEFDLDLEVYELEEEFICGMTRKSKCEKNAIIYAKANKPCSKTKHLLKRGCIAN